MFDKDGSELGLAYFDYFKRDNKSGGAWMSNFVEQSKLLGTKPVIYNVANFTKPAPGQPALISFDDVTTMFHEFGHALHGLFANQTYPLVSGTSGSMITRNLGLARLSFIVPLFGAAASGLKSAGGFSIDSFGVFLSSDMGRFLSVVSIVPQARNGSDRSAL